MKIERKHELAERLSRGWAVAIHTDGTWSERTSRYTDDWSYIDPRLCCGGIHSKKAWMRMLKDFPNIFN